MGLSAQLAIGAHFARHTCHFGGKAVELIHHGVEGAFQFQNFTFHIHGNFFRQITLGDRGGDFGNIAHLTSQICSHQIDVVSQIFPGSRDARYLRLPTQPAVGSYFARHARHFRGKAIELIHHGVNGAFQFENFAFHIYRYFFRQITLGDSGGDLGNIAHLSGQVRCHRIHVIGQIFPGSGYPRHLRLPAQLALGAHFARHARHFGGKAVELIHHGVDGAFQLQNFALHAYRNFLGQIALGYGGSYFGNIAHLTSQIRRHQVDVVRQVFPRSRYARHLRLTTESAVGSYFARHARHFRGKAVKLLHHGVDHFADAQKFALQWSAVNFQQHGLGQVALRNGFDHARDLRGGSHQITDQVVD